MLKWYKWNAWQSDAVAFYKIVKRFYYRLIMAAM